MTIPTHILITNILIIALQLNRQDIILAYIFGVLIDIDHLKPLFLNKEINLKNFYNKITKEKVKLHTILHEPISLLPITIFSIIINNYTPIIFSSTHILIDHIVLKSDKQPLRPFSQKTYTYGLVNSGTKLEKYIISTLSILSTIYLIFIYIN